MSLSEQEYDFISYYYLNKELSGISYNSFLLDIKNNAQSSQSKKAPRPLTAKAGAQKVINKSKENLNEIEEDEDSY